MKTKIRRPEHPCAFSGHRILWAIGGFITIGCGFIRLFLFCGFLGFFIFENNRGKRRQHELKRLLFAQTRMFFRGYTAAVAHVASAVHGGIAVQDLFPESGARDADQVPLPGNRREVAHHQHHIFGIAAFADVRNNAVLPVLEIDPFKTASVKIELMQRARRTVESVQVVHQLRHALMAVVLREVPFKSEVVRPFAPLGKFASHEDQLLAGMRILIGEQQAGVGERVRRKEAKKK